MYPIEMVKVNDPRITSVPSSISYTISFSSPLSTHFTHFLPDYHFALSTRRVFFPFPFFSRQFCSTLRFTIIVIIRQFMQVKIFTFNRGVYFFIFHKIFFHKHFRRHELHKLSSLLDHFPLTILHFLIGSTISKPRYFTRD